MLLLLFGTHQVLDFCKIQLLFFQHCAQAFEVFNLGGGSVDAERKLARIAQACDLEEAALMSEWKDVYPRAQRLLKANANPQDKNKHAWALAMARLSDHHHGRARHPVQVLREALIQYHAFGASSSGVEQSFSRAAWAFGNRNGCARPSTEEFSVKALLDLPKVQDTKSLFRLARVVWVWCFGEARQVCRERIDKGMPRNNQTAGHDEATEAGFIRRRRRAELEAGRRYEERLRAGEQSNRGRGSSDSSDSDVWTEKHEKELQFQNRKLKHRKIQACAENSLLPDEVEDGMLEEAQLCKKNMLAREAARQKKQQKVLAAEQGCSLDEVRRQLTAKTAFLAVAASEELRRGLGQLRLRQVPSASDAEVIICSRPGFLANPRHRLLSALKGCFELSPKLLTHGQGAVLKLHPAASIQRVLLVSTACARQRCRFWRFFRNALPTGHKWTLHNCPLAQMQVLQGNHRSGLCWVVVLKTEQAHEDRCSCQIVIISEV